MSSLSKKHSLHIVSFAILLFLQVKLSFAATVTGRVIDGTSSKLIPCRIYIQEEKGQWYFAKSAGKNGSAVEYKKKRGQESVEMHTTLSAHPFKVDLPPGRYTVTAFRGKEYFSAKVTFNLEQKPLEIALKLKRWINMAEHHWYSGDTHVHRVAKHLPNVQLAEDLNVAFPLSYWVTRGGISPGTSEKSSTGRVKPELVHIDKTHVYYPMNTEYEIFSIGRRQHTLGAVFVLNHQKKFEIGVPPVSKVAKIARAQGALLELDKHNWPWSMMLVPVMNVDLFEITNNHIWRTKFFYRHNFQRHLPPYMNIKVGKQGFTEKNWIEFGFQNYYTLLNCGFHLRPTAGTASGVHPVPLGFGRVYVSLEKGFSYKDWVEGLNLGRSFVTTGPMLMVKINGQSGGAKIATSLPTKCHVTGKVVAANPISHIEIVINGRVAQRIVPKNKKEESGAYEFFLDKKIPLSGTSWVAVRCYTKLPSGRIRFAHSSPIYFNVASKPLRPRPAEINYLIRRVTDEIDRNKSVLSKESLAEYEQALEKYRAIAKDIKSNKKDTADKFGELRLRITEQSDALMASRVHLKDRNGNKVQARGYPAWDDHFVTAGNVSLKLAQGRYSYEIERGPEYKREVGHFDITASKKLQQTIKMKRIANLAKDGWYSGDLHIHRPLKDVPLLMKAEDLHVGPVITWWNGNIHWRDREYPQQVVKKFDTNRYINVMGGEDERNGGALLYFGLKKPLDLPKDRRKSAEFPSPMKFVKQARKNKEVWIDIEKPFWWDVPVWLASGQVDSIGLANNHMCRSTMLANEAWGNPRDVKRLPAPCGNGFWTQEIYYHILNSGLRIAPSAGSASGVLKNPVGYNRVYVHTGKDYSYKKWWKNLKQGNCFVTNGPLLVCRANNKLPGHVFSSPDGKAIELKLDLNLQSNDIVPEIEVIKNGVVVKKIKVAGKSAKKSTTVTFDRSGWFLLRAITSNAKTFRFASTAPFYIEVGENKLRISRQSVNFFVKWCAKRRENLNKTIRDRDEYKKVLAYHLEAEKFWNQLLEKANAE